LKLFRLNKTVKKVAKIPSTYVNKKTNFEDVDDIKKGGRFTKKKHYN
jgi:hypothetical protein